MLEHLLVWVCATTVAGLVLWSSCSGAGLVRWSSCISASVNGNAPFFW